MNNNDDFNPGMDETDVVVEQPPVKEQPDKLIEDPAALTAPSLPPVTVPEVQAAEQPDPVRVQKVIPSTPAPVTEPTPEPEPETVSEQYVQHDIKNYQVNNVTPGLRCKGNAPGDEKHVLNESLCLPHRSRDDLDHVVEKMISIMGSSSPELTRWSDAFKSAMDYYVTGKSFDESLRREDSQWAQHVEGDGGVKLKALAVSPNTSKLKGGSVSGDHAVSVLNRKLKLGSNIAQPLWHSGFWVNIKAPTSTQLIAIDRLISDDKITLGRQTNGLVFSNVSVYLRRAVIDLALSCIYDASIENFSRETLLDTICITDYNQLVLALGCTMNPNGYNLAQPCSDNPGSCKHVTNELVSLPKLAWVDVNALTDWQRTFMSDRGTKKKSLEDIAKYQSEGEWNKPARIVLNDEVTLVTRVPTLREDLESGVKWVAGIVENVQEIYSATVLADEDTLNARIAEQAQASTLRQYEGWIGRYEMTEGDEIITISDRNTISTTCQTLTSDPRVVAAAFIGIGKFIDRTTISLVGIPNYQCPSCQTALVDPSLNQKIIPLAVDELFFTLMRQNIRKVIGSQYTF